MAPEKATTTIFGHEFDAWDNGDCYSIEVGHVIFDRIAELADHIHQSPVPVYGLDEPTISVLDVDRVLDQTPIGAVEITETQWIVELTASYITSERMTGVDLGGYTLVVAKEAPEHGRTVSVGEHVERILSTRHAAGYGSQIVEERARPLFGGGAAAGWTEHRGFYVLRPANESERA